MSGVKFGFKLSIHGQREGVSFRDLLELAQHAEEAGFDGVYVVDHLLLPGSRLSGYTNADPARPYFLDAWTSVAAIAAATRRVRIGPQVTPIGLRHPARGSSGTRWTLRLGQTGSRNSRQSGDGSRGAGCCEPSRCTTPMDLQCST